MFFSISYERKSVQKETQLTQKLLEKSAKVNLSYIIFVSVKLSINSQP